MLQPARTGRMHFHVSGIPETWKFGLIGSETVTLFRFRPPDQVHHRQASPKRAKRVLGAGTKSLSECLRAGKRLELLERLKRLEQASPSRTAEAFGTSSYRGTSGTIGTGFY